MEPALLRLIRTVGEVLNRHGVEYAITGSVASSLHGEPYASADVDYVVRMNLGQARAVARDLAKDYYAPEEGFEEAVHHHGMANAIDAGSGLTADVSVVPPTPYFQRVFERKVRFHLDPGAVDVWLVSPEDIILMKLLWRKDSRSRKQWENALGVVRVQGVKLDWEYLREQARGLDLEADLDRLRDEAGI